MQLNELVKQIERLAPMSGAVSYDNPGLLVDRENTEIRKVLVALDASLPVVREAADIGANMILTHHPLIFNAIKRISRNDGIGLPLYELIRSGIALYSAHTNFDAATNGVNDVLCRLFELTDVETVLPDNIGRIGCLPREMTLRELAREVNTRLNTRSKVAVAAFSSPDAVRVRRVAIIGGAGGDEYALMKALGADVFITGEVKHNQAVEAANIGLSIIAAGHYETEAVAMKSLIDGLQKSTYGVQYLLSTCEKSPLVEC